MKRILLSILVLIPSISVCAQNLIGSWNGFITIGQNSLPLVMHISTENGEKTCLLDSPDQGAENIKAVIDHIGKDSLAIHVPAIGATYNGKLKNGELKGTFCQSGMRFTLNLKPGDFIRERAQTPKPPFAYLTEEITFENKKDHAVLSGTISYPTNYKSQGNKTPVAVLVTGSGQQNRDEEIMGHKPFAVLADYLAKTGIATLRYDDRGFGKSAGDVQNATSYTFMTDALAGIEYLKSTGKFGKIGIIGHSEGGMIAFMSAAESPANIDFIISLAGPSVRGDKVLIRQNEILLSANPATAPESGDYCKVLAKVFDHIIGGQPVGNAQTLITRYCDETGAKLPGAARENLVAILTTEVSPWMKYMLGYDPADAISKVTCPVMAINGEKDTQVDAGMNLDSLRQHLPANDEHLIRSYPGLNHLFQHCTTGLVSEYATIGETISPEVLADIANWINHLE